jgi:hypothetical protein
MHTINYGDMLERCAFVCALRGSAVGCLIFSQGFLAVAVVSVSSALEKCGDAGVNCLMPVPTGQCQHQPGFIQRYRRASALPRESSFIAR